MVAMAHYLGHFAVIYIQVFISVNRYLNVVSRLNAINTVTNSHVIVAGAN